LPLWYEAKWALDKLYPGLDINTAFWIIPYPDWTRHAHVAAQIAATR